MEELYFTVTEDMDGERVDKCITAFADSLSRSFVQKLICDGQVLADGRAVKANYRLRVGETLRLAVPENTEPAVEPEDIPLEILYEDSDLLVVNKPKGMVVHPAAGHTSGTLVNALLWHCRGELSGINGVLRPGIVHRIDKDTTGSVLVCKNDFAHRSIAEQLKEHTVNRVYHAVCCGSLPEEEGTVDAPIGRHPADRKKMAVNERNGKHAVTHYRVLRHVQGYTYVECRLETGRTHQIRVHMAHIGHPLLGDEVYGNGGKVPCRLQGQCLHAKILGFLQPHTQEYIETDAPLPAYFQKLLTIL